MSVWEPILQGTLIWWLLACALQDLRTRTVANWLTVPPVLTAPLLAYVLGGMERVGLTLLILAFAYALWREEAMGAADGKIATVLAAVQPGSLVLGLAMLWILYGLLYLGLRQLDMDVRQCSLPGVVGLYLGYVAMPWWGGSTGHPVQGWDLPPWL